MKPRIVLLCLGVLLQVIGFAMFYVSIWADGDFRRRMLDTAILTVLLGIVPLVAGSNE